MAEDISIIDLRHDDFHQSIKHYVLFCSLIICTAVALCFLGHGGASKRGTQKNMFYLYQIIDRIFLPFVYGLG